MPVEKMDTNSRKRQIDDISTPVFLVGPLRSGTTMLRLMIGNHPRIAFPNEFEIVTPIISDDGKFPSVKEYHDWLSEQRNFRDSDLNFDDDLDFKEQCNSFLQQYKQREQKDFVGSTVHNDFEKLRFVWPDAKYIHLLRDGRDVARSFIPMGWAANVYTGADHWLQVENSWDKLQSFLKDEQCHQVCYEELLQNPEKELTKICEFIGVEYDDAMMKYPETTTYSAPSPEYAFQWKKKQTPEEVGMVESKIGDMLVKRGYELSGYPIIKPGRYMKLRLQTQSKIYRLKFNIKRYGFFLVGQEILSRKLGIISWNRRVRLKIDDLIVQYLK